MFSLPAVIKAEIERVYGQPLKYPADCHCLALSIRDSINEAVGVTTLKRIFGFVSDVKEPRISTLDILARYCGFSDYEEMKRKVASEGDSDFEEEPDIVSARLQPGSLVKFAYLPDRKVTLRHVGGSKFMVIESENGSLGKGDMVTIPYFNKNMPLIVTEVERNGKSLGRYVAGKVSGLISLELAEG